MDVVGLGCRWTVAVLFPVVATARSLRFIEPRRVVPVLNSLAPCFHHYTRIPQRRHDTTHRNSAGTPLALADLWRCQKIHAASTCVTDFFRDVFFRTENACGAVRCVVESFHAMMETTHNEVGLICKRLSAWIYHMLPTCS